jgi:hypothetical protein
VVPDVLGEPDEPVEVEDDGNEAVWVGADAPAEEAGVALEVPVEVAVAVADGLAGAGELGASWVQAAMTTRSLAGSALPPTPLRSTK